MHNNKSVLIASMNSVNYYLNNLQNHIAFNYRQNNEENCLYKRNCDEILKRTTAKKTLSHHPNQFSYDAYIQFIFDRV